MAWAKIFDGQNDYDQLSTPVYLPENSDLKIKVAWNALDSNYQMLFSTWDTGAGTNGQWYFGKLNSSNGTLTLFNRNGSGRSNSPAGTIVAGEYLDLTIERRGDTLRVLSGAVEICAPLVFLTGALDLNPIKVIGKANDASSFHCDISVQTYELIDVDASQLNKWDATVSNHGAGTPITTDTIGGNNATGVNMPTDGSAWVDLGGGSNSVNADLSEQYESFSESLNISLSANVSASVSESYSDFTESLSVSVIPDVNVTTSITESYGDYSEAINTNITEAGALEASIAESYDEQSDAIVANVSINVFAGIIEAHGDFNSDISTNVSTDVFADITESYDDFSELVAAQLPVNITINTKNIVRVKRSSNAVKIRRKSNIVRVR